MRILLLSNYYPEKMGGIELVAHNLVENYRKAGHEVRWVASDLRDHPHTCASGDYPLRAWNSIETKFGFPYPIPFPQDLWLARAHVKWCHVVHLHDSLYLSNQFAYWTARVLRKPVIITQHVGLVPYQQTYKVLLQRMAHGTIGRLLLQGSYQVVFVGQPVKTWFEGRLKFPRPPRLVPNGADLDIFQSYSVEDRMALRTELKIPAASPFLLFVGRFTEKKGLHLIQAVARQHSNWHWVLIGREAEQKPGTWALPNVRVLPPKSQVELGRYYSAADLLVLPSVGEGFPLVIPEAMACGVPALVSDETARALPDLKDMVLTTEPEAASLAYAIARAIENHGSLEMLRIKAKEYARRVFSWQAIASEYVKIFESALAIQPRTP